MFVRGASSYRRRRPRCADQVINRRDVYADLTPVSEVPAVAVRAAWQPLLPGQAVPLIGEVVGYVNPCVDR